MKMKNILVALLGVILIAILFLTVVNGMFY